MPYRRTLFHSDPPIILKLPEQRTPTKGSFGVVFICDCRYFVIDIFYGVEPVLNFVICFLRYNYVPSLIVVIFVLRFHNSIKCSFTAAYNC